MTEKTRVIKLCPYCQQNYPIHEVHVCKNSPEGGLPAVPVDQLVGALLGDRYSIEERVSQGGMGVVYRAKHAVLDRMVAVKILLKQEDEDAQQRFLQEAKIASTMNHPNIVYISDFGVLDDGRPYLVMEYLQGPTLSKVLRSGPLLPLRACQIALQIAGGLQAVHARGIVHRELVFLKIPTERQEDWVAREPLGKRADKSIGCPRGRSQAVDSARGPTPLVGHSERRPSLCNSSVSCSWRLGFG